MKYSNLKMHAERAVPEEAPAIFAEAMVAHVGICENGQPFVIPMSYHYDTQDPGRIYLHGSRQSRLMNVLSSGAPVCIEVTILDELVYSKTAKYHSMNYRSAVCFGRGVEVTNLEKKSSILEKGISRYFPDRREGIEYAAPPKEHLEGTMLIEVTVDEWNAKARRGGPRGPHDSDAIFPGTSGTFRKTG